MALSANTLFEVRQPGTDTNGGGFVFGAAGADFSQQDVKNVTSQGTTTLSGNGGSITSGATTCLVASVTSLYGSRQALLANPLVGDWLLIDSEVVKVTGVSTLTLIIVRAQLGTSAASHNDGATVTNKSNVSTTDVVTTNSSTTITSATAYWSANIVGNLIYLQGGTGTVVAQWRQIMSVSTSGGNTTCVVDATPGAATGGTGVTGNIGGSLATPGQGAALCSVSGHKVWVKYNATPYSITTTSAGTNGPVKFGTTSINASVEGYEAFPPGM
jgi:hypothetical protein